MNNIVNNQSIADFVSPEQLPGVLSETAEVIGTEVALIISDVFGGTKIYVGRWSIEEGKQGKVVSHLVECIGSDATQKFCNLFGGTHITVPSCKNLIRKMRNQAIRADACRGIKRGEIARKYGLSDRRIRGIISTASGQANSSL